MSGPALSEETREYSQIRALVAAKQFDEALTRGWQLLASLLTVCNLKPGKSGKKPTPSSTISCYLRPPGKTEPDKLCSLLVGAAISVFVASGECASRGPVSGAAHNRKLLKLARAIPPWIM